MSTTPLSPDTPEARRYNRIHRWLELSDFALGLGLMLVLLTTGWTRVLRDWAYKGAFQHYTLALCFYVVLLMLIAKTVGLGLDYYGFRVEHRFQLSNQTLGAWAWDEVKNWLVGLVIAVLLAEIVYAMIRVFTQSWWLVSWLIFIVLAVVLTQLAPVLLFPLFYKFKPLENEDLRSRLVRLSERAGTRVRGVYEWKLSEKSKKANAALTGLGTTRRIILSDTLLENYSPDEIEAVLAHELGHHVHQHMLKGIVVQVGITLLGFWAMNQTLEFAAQEHYIPEQLSDFANLPLLVLVATVLSFVLMPAMNAYSRFHERQADRYCFGAIPAVAPFVSAMNKLADQNLAERQPSRIVEVLFHSHPALAKRIAAAEAWGRKS